MVTGKSCAAGALLALGLGLSGCGTPGAPQPPSLNLPGRVADLAAVRTGNQVALTWTMPRRNTDKIPLKTGVDVAICRSEGTGSCVAAGELTVAPGASGSFHESLPSQLATGPVRVLSYYVELKNHIGRSAGLSNAAAVLAGEAPQPVTGLAAELRKAGVVLRWTPSDPHQSIRIERTLLSTPPKHARKNALEPAPEPEKQDLLVPSDEGRAIDKTVTLGQTYEYRVQRVARDQSSGQATELAGAFSAPLSIEVKDIFPPDAPAGLAAVATPAADSAPASIDLNWSPNTEADLSGYFVYRREDAGTWQRISGAQPVPAPAFHDAQVQPGHTYHYVVSAVDKASHESAKSAQAQETVPEQ